MSGLERLLRPRSIAVIGGGTWCESVVEQCKKIGFSGDIWPVHPNRRSVGGVTAFPSVADLPEGPDASFIGVNRDLTIEIVHSLSEKGGGGAVCFASGFSEAETELGGGTDRQRALLEAAGHMTFLGPNCYGFVNYLDGVALWPDQHGGRRVDRGVAIIAQSSNIALNLTMQARGLPVAYVLTVGNQAQTGISDLARGLLDDPRVTAIGLHIEGIDDLRAFEALAKAAKEQGVPIVALKVGASRQARVAAVSHTASLVGSEAGARALFRRLGIGQAFTLTEFLETLKLLHVVGPLPSNRIASLSCSGGEASLVADMAQSVGLVLPELSDTQRTALRDALGPMVALANPLDYHTFIWADEAALTTTFSAMMQADVSIGCVVLDLPRQDRCDPAAWDPALCAVRNTKDSVGKPMAVIASLPENLPEEVAERLIAEGVVPFSGMLEALTAISVAARMGGPVADGQPVLLPGENAQTRTLSEAEAKSALRSCGVAVPQFLQASSPVAAASAAERIGFPVALKGEGFAHKSEANAVALGLRSKDEVRTAAEAMSANSFLVEAMVLDASVEILVGVLVDPAHGYVLTLAAGGLLTELLEDNVSLLIPASRDEVRRAIRSLRVGALVEGYRGKPAADMEAILNAVMAVQRYVEENPLEEMEINPLICGPSGAVAADALIRLGVEI